MKFDFQGVLNNFTSKRLDPIARGISRLHVRTQNTLFGKVMDRYLGAPTFQLTVRGRKSGEPRAVMLMLTRRGDDLVVVGSNGGNTTDPNWFRNLRAAGQANVKVGDESWDVTFRIVEGAEREECWRLATENYPQFATYQKLTDRQIPVGVLERRSDLQ